MKKNNNHKNEDNFPKYLDDACDNVEEILHGISDEKLFGDFKFEKMESRFSSLGMVLKLTNRKGKKFSVIVCDDELTDPYKPDPNKHSELSRMRLLDKVGGCLGCFGKNIYSDNLTITNNESIIGCS